MAIMTKRLFLAVLISATLAISAEGAKYAGDSFSLGAGGRALAMGAATIAGPFDASTVYWNPAGLNYLEGNNLLAMHGETFGSLLNHDFVAFTKLRPDCSCPIKGYGFYLYYLGGNGIKITDVNPQTGRPYAVDNKSHGDFYVGASFSMKPRGKVDLGATIRVLFRDIPSQSGFGASFDAGLLYKAGSSLMLGLSAVDITTGFIKYSNGNTESILPTIKPAISYSRPIGNIMGRLAISGDIKFEGRRKAAQVDMGEISLDSHFGLEISYREILFGRTGLDAGDFTTGLGVRINRLTFDFNYLYNSELDETFRASAGIQF